MKNKAHPTGTSRLSSANFAYTNQQKLSTGGKIIPALLPRQAEEQQYLFECELHKRRRFHPPDRGCRKRKSKPSEAGCAVGAESQRCSCGGGASGRRTWWVQASPCCCWLESGGPGSSMLHQRLLTQWAVAHLLLRHSFSVLNLGRCRRLVVAFSSFSHRTERDERAAGPRGVEARGGKVW